MRKFLLTVALLAVTICGSAETKQTLTLHLESGARIDYYLDTEPEITFEGQNMVVAVDGEATDIPMQDVDRWEIGMVEYTGIESIADADRPVISVDGSTVKIQNPDATAIGVYDTSGRVVKQSHGSEMIVTLPRGIYVVTVGNKSIKIAIR